MKFTEVRTYVKEILKGFFLNKKILDKFSYNDNSDTLLYDDYPIGERINTNALNETINSDAAELYFGHDGNSGVDGGSSGSSGGTVIAEAIGDGSTTVSALLDSLYAQLQVNGGLDEKKNYKMLLYYNLEKSFDIMTQQIMGDTNISFITFWQGTNEIKSDYYLLKSSGSKWIRQTSKDSNSTTDRSSETLPNGNKFTIIEYSGIIRSESTPDLSEIEAKIGDLSELETTAKTDLVSAINEVAQSGSGDGGSLSAYEILDTTTNMTWPNVLNQFASKISSMTEKELSSVEIIEYATTANNIVFRFVQSTQSSIVFSVNTYDFNAATDNSIFLIIDKAGLASNAQFYRFKANTAIQSATLNYTTESVELVRINSGAGSAGYEVLAESQSGDTYLQALERFKSVLSAMSEEEVVNTALIDGYGNNAFVLMTLNERDTDYIQYFSVEGNTSNICIYKYRIWLSSTSGTTFAKYVLRPDNGSTPTVTDQSSNTVTSLKLVRLAGGSGSGNASSEDIGDLADLTTSDKTNLVSAINEVNTLANGKEIVLATGTGSTHTDKFLSLLSAIQTLSDDQLLNSYIKWGGRVYLFIDKATDNNVTSYMFSGVIGSASTVTNVVITISTNNTAYGTVGTINGSSVSTIVYDSEDATATEIALCLKASQTKIPTGAIEVSKVTSGTIGAAIDSFYDLIDLDETPLWYIFVKIPNMLNAVMPYIGGTYKFASINFENIASSASENEYLRKALCASSNSKFYESTSDYSSTTISSDSYVALYKVANVSGSSSSHKVLGTVTSDGVKTWAALLKDLWDACQVNGGFDARKKYELRTYYSDGSYFPMHQGFTGLDQTFPLITFSNSTSTWNNDHAINETYIQSSGTQNLCLYEQYVVKPSSRTYNNYANTVQSAGTRVEIIEV